MRRIAILCLLLWLPWSWSWAGTGDIGAHECGCLTVAAGTDELAPVGHDGADGPCAGGTAGDACGPDCGPDCVDGHGQTLAAGLGLPALPLAHAATPSAGKHAQPFRNHIPDHLLRPPRVARF